MTGRTRTSSVECSSGTPLAGEGRSNDTGSAHIVSLGYAFWKSKVLLTAVELDLFTVLAEGSLDVRELARRIQLHERGAQDFFDALVALKLLHRRDGRYANRPETAPYLVRNQPMYLGDLLQHLNQRHYQNWGLLTQALRTGMPQSGALATGYSALYADPSIQKIFL